MSLKTTTTTTKSTILSPVHHQQYIAVQLPEVVSHILSYLAPCDNTDSFQPNSSSIIRRNTNHLYQCLLINRLWYECTLRHLWRHVVFEESESETVAFHQFASSFANRPITNPTLPLLPTSYSSSTPLTLPADPSPRPVADEIKKVPPTPSLSTPLFTQVTRQQQPVLSSNLPSVSPSSRSIELRHKSLRSLTLRHIKKGHHTTASLAVVAEHASHLQRLSLYIGDYVTNEALTPFFMHTPSCLTHISLAGCPRVSDASILVLASHAPDLVYLDLRACDLVSDISLTAIATSCPRLHHLNVGRIHGRRHITDPSIVLVAQHTQVAVLGLAGCDIGDQTILALATHRRHALERVSVNQCHRLTNHAIQALLSSCPNVSVFEMKGCPSINDWRTIEALVDRKVSLTLNDQQKLEFQKWSRWHGKNKIIIAPVKH